jgi:hypothetical protein
MSHTDTSTKADLQQLAIQLYVPLFAERPTIKEAYAYAQEIANSTNTPAAVMTAIHVVLNTVDKEIERINEGA